MLRFGLLPVLSLLFSFTAMSADNARVACAADTKLQFYISTVNDGLNAFDLGCHERDGSLAKVVGVDHYQSSVFEHDVILPSFYTDNLTNCEHTDELGTQGFIAWIIEYQRSPYLSFQDFQSLGWMHISDSLRAQVSNLDENGLKEMFHQSLQALGCLVDEPNLQNAADCANTNFDAEIKSSLRLVPSVPGKKSADWTQSKLIMDQIQKTLATHDSCDQKKDSIAKILSQPITTDDLDDFTVLTWMTKHPELIVTQAPLRQLLAGATQLNKPIHGAAYSWKESFSFYQPNSFSAGDDSSFSHSAVRMKIFLEGVTLEALQSVGASSYDDFIKLPVTTQAQVMDQIQNQLSHGVDSVSYQNQVVQKERDQCNGKIARILGGPGMVASATGDDWAGAQEVHEKLVERFHTFKTMHLYPGDIAKSHAPVFAPKGYTSGGPGASAESQGSYNLYYPKLGRYQNVILNFNHLADFENLLHNRSCPKASSCPNAETNAAGSVRVGSTGGVGGSGDGPYDHSHINLIMMADGYTKLNFMDAFCK